MKRAGKEEGKEQGERREKGKKGKEERRPVTSTQTLHCESLVPSTAFQCKHRHPICDRVNWFFDVSRKVLIEGGVGGGRLFLSPQTPVYLFKKKKSFLIPKSFPLSPPQSPLPLESSSHLAVILDHGFSQGHGGTFFFFRD